MPFPCFIDAVPMPLQRRMNTFAAKDEFLSYTSQAKDESLKLHDACLFCEI